MSTDDEGYALNRQWRDSLALYDAEWVAWAQSLVYDPRARSSVTSEEGDTTP